MFQEVFQKQYSCSIGTVLVYEKCMIVSHGYGIGFGTLSEKKEFLEYINI